MMTGLFRAPKSRGLRGSFGSGRKKAKRRAIFYRSLIEGVFSLHRNGIADDRRIADENRRLFCANTQYEAREI
jgi:hypothetical protein